LPRFANASFGSPHDAGGRPASIQRCGTRLYPIANASPARMSNDAPRLSLLDELDARQTELLEELDRLNERIEQVLRDCLSLPQPQLQPVKVRAAA
jgi:hypothetical protein